MPFLRAMFRLNLIINRVLFYKIDTLLKVYENKKKILNRFIFLHILNTNTHRVFTTWGGGMGDTSGNTCTPLETFCTNVIHITSSIGYNDRIKTKIFKNTLIWLQTRFVQKNSVYKWHYSVTVDSLEFIKDNFLGLLNFYWTF